MGKYDVRIHLTCPAWMLEDMRTRARRQNTTVTEWIRQAVTAKRNAEDEAAERAYDEAVAGSATPTDTGPSTRSEAGGGELVRPVGERRAEQPARPVAGSATPTIVTDPHMPKNIIVVVAGSATPTTGAPASARRRINFDDDPPGSATPTGDDDDSTVAR
jgi:hypothetical protein